MHSKPAFLASLVVRPSLRPTLVLTLSRSCLFPSVPTRRRLRLQANSNLYPEPDTPDPSQPSPNSQSPSNSGQDGQRLFNELNARQQNRGDNSRISKTTLDATSADTSAQGTASPNSVLTADLSDNLDYKGAARALWRLGWFAWWIQLILTVISGVILLFSFAFPGVSVGTSTSIFGFVLSGLGVLLAFFSLFWTYSYTRLSLWLGKEANRTAQIVRARISRKLQVGLVLALVGLIVSLLGTQAIVGTLLAKLLSAGVVTTSSRVGSLPSTAGIVQPVDVLAIQACANAMMAFTAALTVTVWLRGRSKKWLESKRA